MNCDAKKRKLVQNYVEKEKEKIHNLHKKFCPKQNCT
jgi:hypothetical protein